IWQISNESICAGRLRCIDNFVNCGTRSGITNVLRDARGEQNGLLRNKCELVTEAAKLIVGQVHTVQQNFASRWVVKATQQTDQRSLAWASFHGNADM